MDSAATLKRQEVVHHALGQCGNLVWGEKAERVPDPDSQQPDDTRLIQAPACPLHGPDAYACCMCPMYGPLMFLLPPPFTRLADVADRMLPVKWREHSFLDNPRCPEAVKRSKLTVYTSTVSSSAAYRRMSSTSHINVQPPRPLVPPCSVALPPRGLDCRSTRRPGRSTSYRTAVRH